METVEFTELHGDVQQLEVPLKGTTKAKRRQRTTAHHQRRMLSALIAQTRTAKIDRDRNRRNRTQRTGTHEDAHTFAYKKAQRFCRRAHVPFTLRDSAA